MVETSTRARSTPCRMLTTAMGRSATFTAMRSVMRSGQPGSLVGSLASLAGGIGTVWRREAIQLRHNFTGSLPFGRSVRLRQRFIAVEDGDERLARPRHPALHRTYGTIADFRGILIGEAAGPHQNQSFTLLVGQGAKGARRVGQLGRPPLVLPAAWNSLGRFLVPGRLSPGTPAVGIELVAQDGEKPGLQIRARHEGIARLPGLYERLLCQVVSALMAAAKGAGEGTQEGHEAEELGLEIVRFGRCRHVRAGGGVRGGHDDFFPGSPWASILRSRSRNSSGTGSWATASNMRRSSRPMTRWRARMARAFSRFGFSLDTFQFRCCGAPDKAVLRKKPINKENQPFS